MVLKEDLCPLRCQSHTPNIPSIFSLLCAFEPGVSSQLSPLAPTPAALLPSVVMVDFHPSGTSCPNTPFLLQAALVMVVYHSNNKVTNTIHISKTCFPQKTNFR